MRVAVATNSIDKINGIKQVFSLFYRTEVEVYHQAVETGVPEQPFDEETYRGAINRVNTLMAYPEEADFYVSCEAGIEGFFGKYFNVQVVCIFERKSQSYAFGKSAGWQVPTKDIEAIRKENLDTYLRKMGYNSLEEVLGPGNSRESAVAQATEMALRSLQLQ